MTNQRPIEEPSMRTFENIGPGSVVVVHQHKVGGARRLGEILELLGDESHRRFHVRWEDGHESIFFPAEDTIIEPVEPHRRPRAR